MSADFNKPSVTSLYSNFATEVIDNCRDLAKGLDPAHCSPVNVPTYSIRWNSVSNLWETYNGTSWVAMSALYAINISGNAATASAAPWSGISSKPTTLSGYGISSSDTMFDSKYASKSFVTTLVGTDGTKATARKTLLEPGDAGKFYRSNGTTSDPTWETLPSGGASDFFKAHTSSITNATGDSTYYYLTSSTEDFDVSSAFNASSGVFTVPSTGYYQFNLFVKWSNAEASSFSFSLGVGNDFVLKDSSQTSDSLSLSTIIHLTMSDTVSPFFKAAGGSKTVDIGEIYISGCKIG